MKEYWRCEIGPIERSKVGEPGDPPMRDGVAKAFYSLTGEWPKLLSSGWGYSSLVSDDFALLVQERDALKEQVKQLRVASLEPTCGTDRDPEDPNG